MFARLERKTVRAIVVIQEAHRSEKRQHHVRGTVLNVELLTNLGFGELPVTDEGEQIQTGQRGGEHVNRVKAIAIAVDLDGISARGECQVLRRFHLREMRYARRSRNSWTVSPCARPSGMSDTFEI